MNTASLTAGWPGRPSFIVARATPDSYEPLVTVGDLDEERPWASVSKLVAALAVVRTADEGGLSLETPAGPEGATIAHLLAHASGLGFEAEDRVVPVGTRRVYSNVGIDIAVGAVTRDPELFLRERVLAPLGVRGTWRHPRPSHALAGSVRELAALARELLVPTLLSADAHREMVHPFLPDLSGITPPFGRQTPNWWGLGPELKGTKEHWMGHWPAASFGHFGQSGALLLCDPTTNLFVVATSSQDFGAWAVALWPQWIDAVRAMVLA